MECEILLAPSRQALAAGQAQRETVPLAPFDVDRMRQGYYQEKKSLQKGFEQFAARWEAEWRELPRPQAGLIGWTQDELESDFIPTFKNEERELSQALREQCTQAWAAVWTIGPELEDVAFSEVKNSTLQAMFLDVAGSLMMGSIRTALHEFVADRLADQGLAVLGEHIPEISEQDPRLRRIAAPWLDAPSAWQPSFRMQPNGVLHPLKSQCAMFFIGPPRTGQKVRLDELPCSHCKGNKCLYRQFGGCHLPIKLQPGKKEHDR